MKPMNRRLCRRPRTAAETKAFLLKMLVFTATDHNADPTDHDAALTLDRIEDALVQHHGMTYEEVHAIIAEC